MKSIVRWVYILLVGLIVLTGALFIAQGALSGNQKLPAVQDSAPEGTEAPQPDDDALPAPEQRLPEFNEPDGPAQFI